jgi:pimeloyl-ACP methyl ester carboxylesterase
MQERFVSYQNKQLFYRVIGQGANALVYLHGFPEDGRVWEAQQNLKTSFTVIVPDLPGSGRSEAIDDMSMEGLAASVKHIIEAELQNSGGTSPYKTVLVGHSMGGYIALAFAELYPQQVLGIGLFHSTAYADSPEKIASRQKGIEFIRKHGPSAFLKNTIQNLFAPETRETRPGLIEEQIQQAYNFSGETLVSYYEGMMKRPDRTHILIQSHVPFLFILGRWDQAVPLEDGLKLCHLPEISYIGILEHSAHMGMKEETSKSNEFLTGFLHYFEKSVSDS